MILPDVNILLYSYNKGDSRFDRTRRWFEDLINGTEPACFCWETINGFMRLSTNSRAMPNPFSLSEAFSIVDEWLQCPNAIMLEPTKNHQAVLKAVSIEANAVGSLYSDAVLAALAISHNAIIASTDRDFRLFKGLKLIDPLAADQM